MNIDPFQYIKQAFDWNFGRLNEANELLRLSSYMLDERNKMAKESIEGLRERINNHLKYNIPQDHHYIIDEQTIKDYAEHNERIKNQ
jgi:hypothetical protein